MTWTKRDSLISLCLACFAGFLFIPFFSTVPLFEGTEATIAEISREMLVTGNYQQTQLDFQLSWQYPPLIHWLQSASMRVFGVNEFGVRFPNILLGILMMPLLYLLGKQLYSEQLGILWAICYAVPLLPILYHKSALASPLANVFVLVAIWLLSSFYAPKQGKIFALRRIVLAGVCLGVAILTTGITMIPVIICTWLGFWFLRRSSLEFPITETAVLLAVALLVSLTWFGGELWKSGIPFFREFSMIQIRGLAQGFSDHSLPLYTPIIMVLLGFFPTSTLMLSVFRHNLEKMDSRDTFKTWMVLLLSVILILCIICPQKVSEFSLAGFPLSFLAAYSLLLMFGKQETMPIYLIVCIASFGMIWSVLLLLIPFLGLHPELMPQGLLTLFVHGLENFSFISRIQSTENSWSIWDTSIGVALGIGVILFLIFSLKKRTFEAVFTLLFCSGIIFFLVTNRLLPKLEQSAQESLITFYRSISKEECYVHTLGFHSSLALFYTNKQYAFSAAAQNIPPEDFETWLLEADIDKPAYFVCKIDAAKHWRNHIRLTEVQSNNSFVFFKRQGRTKNNLAFVRSAR